MTGSRQKRPGDASRGTLRPEDLEAYRRHNGPGFCTIVVQKAVRLAADLMKEKLKKLMFHIIPIYHIANLFSIFLGY